MKSNRNCLTKSIISLIEIISYSLFSILLYWVMFDLLVDHLNRTDNYYFINEFRLLFFILICQLFLELSKKYVFINNLLLIIIFSFSIIQILILTFNYCIPEYNYKISSKVILFVFSSIIIFWNILKIRKYSFIDIVKISLSCIIILIDLIYFLIVYYAIYDIIW